MRSGIHNIAEGKNILRTPPQQRLVFVPRTTTSSALGILHIILVCSLCPAHISTHHGSREPWRGDCANVARARGPKPGKGNASERLRRQPRPGVLDASIDHEPDRHTHARQTKNRRGGGNRPTGSFTRKYTRDSIASVMFLRCSLSRTFNVVVTSIPQLCCSRS